jgi:hypothetical protein
MIRARITVRGWDVAPPAQDAEATLAASPAYAILSTDHTHAGPAIGNA